MDWLFNIPILNDIPLAWRYNMVDFILLFALFAIAWLLRKRISYVMVLPIRAITRRTGTHTDDFLVATLNKFMGYIVLAVPLYASIYLLSLTDTAQEFIFIVANTLVAYAIFRFLYDLTTHLLTTPKRLEKITGYDVKPALMPIIKLSGRVLIIVVGALSIAQIWGWNIAGLIAGVGLGGLAISLAAKDILDDILGYAVIITDNIFREDEYIVSPSGEGIVEEIGVRSTHIRQLNQGLVIVPNAKLTDDWVTNWSRLEKRWFNFVVGITYSATGDKIQQFVNTLTERLKAREHVQEDSVVVLFTEYDDSSLNVLIRSYVDLPDWVDAHVERHAVNLLIMETLKEIGLEVAFPSRSLYLENMPKGLAQSITQGKSNTQTHNKSDETQQHVTSAGYSDDNDAEIAEKSESNEEEGTFA